MPNKHSVFGDSISTFKGLIPDENRWYYDDANMNGTGVTNPEDTWWMQAIKADGGELLANASFSGSMVQGAGFPAGRSRKRADQLCGANGERPDIVWVFMGINDYGWGSPEAQIVAGSEAAPREISHLGGCETMDPAGPAPKDAAERFGRAYAEMLANVRTVAPDAEIRCMTLLPGRVVGAKESTHCYNLRGVPFDDYNDRIRVVAGAVGATLVDIRALGMDYESTDGTHPNHEGMRQLAQLVSVALEMRNLADAKDAVGASVTLGSYPTNMRSRCACDLSLAQGCSHADRESIRWSCVRQDG